MTVDIQKAKEEFLKIYRDLIHRNGSEALLAWLNDSTDFFTAPASTKYHLNVPGGLCQHSINVYYRLADFLEEEYKYYENAKDWYNAESVALVALFHDLCKTNMYKSGWKNQKTYDPDKVMGALPRERKHDNAGDFIWETVPTYEIDEDFTFGHGEKSVYLLMKFVRLTDEEAQAIRYHMASYKQNDVNDCGKVFERNPLAFFLHVADEAATFIDEGKN